MARTKPATPEQRREIAELYRLYLSDGLSQSESIKRLAANLGRSADGIREILKREGIELVPSRQSNKVFENQIEFSRNAIHGKEFKQFMERVAERRDNPQESIYPQAGEAEDAEFDAKRPPLDLVDFYTFDGCSEILELVDEIPLQEIGRGAKEVEDEQITAFANTPIPLGDLEFEDEPEESLTEQEEIHWTKIKELYDALIQRTPETSEDYEIKPVAKDNLPKEKRIKLTGSKVELFGTDIHFPFENKSAWQIFLDVARDTQPDIIWLNGDNLDGYSVSQWAKDPNISHDINIQYEFDYCREQLTILRNTAPNAQIFYKEGNHETRLQRFLDKNAPALRSLRAVTVPFNLDLERLEIEWVENNDKYRIGELWHFHGNEIGGGGANIALAKLRKLMSPCIFGHYHTSQSAIIRKYDGHPIGAWAVASLCDYDQDYVHHAETWTNELARIEYLPSGIFHVQQSQFLKDGNKMICRVDGQWFEKEIV